MLAALAPVRAQEQIANAPSGAGAAATVVLTPQLLTRWLAGADAMRAAMEMWEAQRNARANALMAELRAPTNQTYLACRDRLATDSAYRTLVWRLAEARDSAAIGERQRQMLAASRAACGAMPATLFDPDTTTGPDPTPDFMAAAERASGLDRVTFARVAQRIITWGILETRK